MQNIWFTAGTHFGHTHGEYGKHGRSMDVGVDNTGYMPIHIDDVISVLKDKNPTPIIT